MPQILLNLALLALVRPLVYPEALHDIEQKKRGRFPRIYFSYTSIVLTADNSSFQVIKTFSFHNVFN